MEGYFLRMKKKTYCEIHTLPEPFSMITDFKGLENSLFLSVFA